MGAIRRLDCVYESVAIVLYRIASGLAVHSSSWNSIRFVRCRASVWNLENCAVMDKNPFDWRRFRRRQRKLLLLILLLLGEFLVFFLVFFNTSTKSNGKLHSLDNCTLALSSDSTVCSRNEWCRGKVKRLVSFFLSYASSFGCFFPVVRFSVVTKFFVFYIGCMVVEMPGISRDKNLHNDSESGNMLLEWSRGVHLLFRLCANAPR